MIDGARVLSVRTTPYGFKRRRYQLADGRRITTYEVPYAVLSHMGAARLREAARTPVQQREKKEPPSC